MRTHAVVQRRPTLVVRPEFRAFVVSLRQVRIGFQKSVHALEHRRGRRRGRYRAPRGILQQRRQKFGGIAGGAEGDGADEPVAAGHQRVGAGIKQQIDDLVVTVVFGRRLLEFHGAMKRAVVVRRLGFNVRIGAVLQQERDGVRLSDVAGVHDGLPVRGKGFVLVNHVAHGIGGRRGRRRWRVLSRVSLLFAPKCIGSFFSHCERFYSIENPGFPRHEESGLRKMVGSAHPTLNLQQEQGRKLNPRLLSRTAGSFFNCWLGGSIYIGITPAFSVQYTRSRLRAFLRRNGGESGIHYPTGRAIRTVLVYHVVT